MDIFKAAERMMRMDDATWARHANPWSVYTRFSCLPLLVVAIWSRDWIGGWAFLVMALTLAWTFVNPRLFSEPATLDSWASKGVLGERHFLARAARPVPTHHVTWAKILTWVSGSGAIVLAYGLWRLDLWATLCGLSITVLGKVWFVDRMVWLYEDMRRGSSAP